MRVYLYSADRFGCGHYRLLFVAKVLQDQGHDVIVVQSGLASMVAHGRRGHIRVPNDADVIVLQRPAPFIIAEAVHMIRARGVAVVVDVDDDLKHIHPSNPAFVLMHPKYSPAVNWQHVARACRDATMVTVSTPALVERYGAHGRARVLPNYVPASYLQIPHSDREQPVIGWAGSLHSHPDDFRQAAGTLSRYARDGGKVHIVGPRDGIAEQLGTESFTASGALDFAQWPLEVANLNIGVAPLASTTFNEAKSWLKPLEYASTGVPWVASDLPEYRKLAKLNGGGEVVAKPKDWWRAVSRLATDRGLRSTRSAEGRALATTMTYEDHAWKWLEAWQEALTIERGSYVRHSS